MSTQQRIPFYNPFAVFAHKSQKYTKLSEKEDIEELLNPSKEWHAFRPRLKILLLATIVLSIAISVLAWHKRTPELEWVPCGSTAAEARAANCHYEPMQRSWIPDACYFEEPASEYDPFSDREWFSDRNRTILADLDDLRSGDAEMAYLKYFHDEHCIYNWRKLHLATIQKRRLIDTKTYDLHHTTHCAMVIAKLIVDSQQEGYQANPLEGTESPLMFQGCVRLH